MGDRKVLFMLLLKNEREVEEEKNSDALILKLRKSYAILSGVSLYVGLKLSRTTIPDELCLRVITIVSIGQQIQFSHKHTVINIIMFSFML